jgi:hypothetical protein
LKVAGTLAGELMTLENLSPAVPQSVNVQTAIRDRLDAEAATIALLTEPPTKLKKAEEGRLRDLERVAEHGLADLKKKRPKSAAKLDDLVTSFLEYGVTAIFGAGAQRGGDFLLNQLRGRWAEEVVLSMEVSGIVLKPFGPTGAAMPGEEDYRHVRITFDAISRLEGKRPDIIGFRQEVYSALTSNQKALIDEWPSRPLNVSDSDVIKQACVGIEVKNSAWHYGNRRKAGGYALSVTVKEEEVQILKSWSERYDTPVVFVQVLFDEAYAMSFTRMQEFIQMSKGKRKPPFLDGDYHRDTQSGEKDYHHLYTGLRDHTYLCADVVFPDKSVAAVRALKDGSVIPYIKLAPSKAVNVRSDTMWREINY